MPAWANYVWRAWEQLHHDRALIPIGMGASMPGKIPWLAIDRWARRHGIAGGDFEFLLSCLSAMDEEYQVHQARINRDGSAA